MRLHRRLDDRGRLSAAGTVHHRDDRDRRSAEHRDAGPPDAERLGGVLLDAEPADAGCYQASGAGPCPERMRRGCCPDAGRPGAVPCPARTRTGCCRGAGLRAWGRRPCRRNPQRASQLREPRQQRVPEQRMLLQPVLVLLQPALLRVQARAPASGRAWGPASGTSALASQHRAWPHRISRLRASPQRQASLQPWAWKHCRPRWPHGACEPLGARWSTKGS